MQQMARKERERVMRVLNEMREKEERSVEDLRKRS